MQGKKYREAAKKIDFTKKYPLEEAVQFLQEIKTAKFDESVEVALRLGIDAKQSDQGVRGAVSLPHGIGKNVRVLALAKGDKEKEAKEAGADYVGADDLLKKIQEGWTDFDKVVATPDLMPAVSKVGKILGPRGLMPNPKTGTVTFDIGKAVKEMKAGKVDFRNDKAGNVQAAVGKISFGPEKIKDNIQYFIEAIVKAKPSSSKGVFLKGISISGTMSPSIRIDSSSFAK